MKIKSCFVSLPCILLGAALAAGCKPPQGQGGTDQSAGARAERQSSGSGVNSEPSSTDSRNLSTTNENAAKPPDNTGRNVQDRSDTALTPGDQSNSKADLEITRQIRRRISQNDQLSTEAKNIKIITVNGKVTLRGPVKNAQEKQMIESAAQTVAGTGGIDNQLEPESNQ